MGFRFLHLADCHLETSFGGRPATRERLREATWEAFERAVDHAIENRLDAVLVAGDLYDDPLLSTRTELWLVRQIRRLAEAGIWFLHACGNHDPGGPRHRAAGLGIEADEQTSADDWRRRVHCFRESTPRSVSVSDAEGRPVGVVVGAGHPTEWVGENLATRFRAVPSELPRVGLLHTQVETARTAETHDRYAPSARGDYERLDYNYWALGHVHLRQQAFDGLPAYYAGNLQGRHFRETGAKGAYVVEAGVHGPALPSFLPLAPLRFEQRRFEVPPHCESAAALTDALGRFVDALGDGSAAELAVRLDLVGATPLATRLGHAEEREQIARELEVRTGAREIQLRNGGVSRPVDLAELRRSPTVLARALELIEAAQSDDELLRELAPEPLAHDLAPGQAVAYLRELLQGLPDELVQRSLEEDAT
jgi:DNA repair exonuclease SbcCD nuclease subunit